jgi:tripartite-type tricarboxylate transporter receptor subunit TctC
MLKDPGAARRFEDAFLDLMPLSQKQFAAFVAAEFPRWEKVVRASGLQPE